MAQVEANWTAAPTANLIGVAKLRQAAGEPIHFNCGGRIFIFIVMEGQYQVRSEANWTELTPGDVYYVRRLDTEIGADTGALICATSSTATVLCASFSANTTSLHAMVKTLPETFRISSADVGADPKLDAAFSLLRDEFRPGDENHEMVSNHLFEALFLYILRHWYRQNPRSSRELKALCDPYLSRAIEEMHRLPDHRWTIEELASVAGLSRAAFAKRFKQGIGATPQEYLTHCRMNIAAEMLGRSLRIQAIAESVGYSSEFAFSRAFRRFHGMPPTRFRRTVKLT